MNKRKRLFIQPIIYLQQTSKELTNTDELYKTFSYEIQKQVLYNKYPNITKFMVAILFLLMRYILKESAKNTDYARAKGTRVNINREILKLTVHVVLVVGSIIVHGQSTLLFI